MVATVTDADLKAVARTSVATGIPVGTGPSRMNSHSLLRQPAPAAVGFLLAGHAWSRVDPAATAGGVA
jgi:hypothetical protein